MASEKAEPSVVPVALVIGGGIAGMQAALDIADKGFQVHLVEKDPSIGGHMAQLDKTFPTLDCSACTITPKMVDTANHPNIELLTYTEVVHIEGKAGHFKVLLRKKPRYVDMAKCTACADCVPQCPVSLPNEFDMGLGIRKAIYIPFPQAVPLKYTIERRGTPPCTAACPAHCNAQGYVALISRGKYEEALHLVMETIPLPGVLGRICPHPCEDKCNRASVDQPIAICDLKRFAADRAEKKPRAQRAGGRSEKVAVIGSGPAGLSAAYYLSLEGYGVTLFEKLPVLGGMLRAGIPEYRLPREVLDEEIGYILSLGVEIKTNTPIGEEISIEDLFSKGFKAIFIASGAHRDAKLNIPGEESRRVIPGVALLAKINSGERVKVGESVAVVGGGNVAIDAARSALRTGARGVVILYRRSRREMPASDEEIEEALSEGIEIRYLVAPTEIVPHGEEEVEIRCVRMRLDEPDATGRRRPIPVEGSEFTLKVDTVIPAIGQAPDLAFISPESGIDVTKGGTLWVDPVTFQTSREGVFAGGDAVTGPGLAIEAVAAGREAAISIHRYLMGHDMREGREPASWRSLDVDDLLAKARRELRVKGRLLPLKRRRDGFEEVRLGLTEDDARREATRCLGCGGCAECGECARACQPQAVDYGMTEEVVELHVGAIIVATGFDPFDPKGKPELGYGVYSNVLHGLELERLCSASGPTEGEILIGGEKPKDVVFVHCVGSRDKTVGNAYCSRVCCMYTAKQAHLVKEKIPEAQVTVLYMDMRAFGKGFEEFYERVQKEGVVYRRGSPSEVYRENGKLVVRGEDTLVGEPFELPADLVVLASGLIPREENDDLTGMLGLEKASDRFYAEAPGLDPILSGVEGVFLAGCCQGPKDIPDTVAQASGAASLACGLLIRGKTPERRV